MRLSKHSKMIELSFAADADVPRVLEIDRESISPPWTLEALQGELCREDSFFTLARIEIEIAGFCILRRMGDMGDLLKIAVDRNYRRCGVADMLVSAALAWAAEHGLSAVFLEVRESNAAAIELYKKHGFEEARRRVRYYDTPVEDALIFIREIGGNK